MASEPPYKKQKTSSPAEPHKIVIVGGNFAGINLAHYLLHDTLPGLQKLHPDFSYKVTLVTPNTHFFFKVTAPREIVRPDQVPEEELFPSIVENFVKYRSSFKYVRGKAVALRDADSTVIVKRDMEQEELELQWDALAIATGATPASPLWTLHDNRKETKAAIMRLHQRLAKAAASKGNKFSAVIVTGEGPLGIEVAGDVAHAYPGTRVVLMAPGERLLPSLPPQAGEDAKTALEALGVYIKLNERIVDSRPTTTNVSVMLHDGDTMSVGAYIDATGPRTLNTGWLPKAWLDEGGHVLMRDENFRIHGGPGRIYAIGEVVVGSGETAVEVDGMAATVASSIGADINTTLGGGI
ncbi:FAD/NAD(P)-binding domain-containing protein [Bimuria novae-zelandiae CBS 107.79]|uniref:FAD/NAD(P)-binding domain-containing protein n=1 Tax=Bimuria novae-zelandiae CBS 107.79 TaxID=1447943 RepID=A0A6A5VW17_9PLEO|nr:FAD/NAD(P)-binding domain-containing protein [Bimuria novae-zelandiae CBS 107.79]